MEAVVVRGKQNRTFLSVLSSAVSWTAWSSPCLLCSLRASSCLSSRPCSTFSWLGPKKKLMLSGVTLNLFSLWPSPRSGFSHFSSSPRWSMPFGSRTLPTLPSGRNLPWLHGAINRCSGRHKGVLLSTSQYQWWSQTLCSVLLSRRYFLYRARSSPTPYLALHGYTEPNLAQQVFSLVPIKILGAALNLVHQCLLHSLYCFEYKWFSQVHVITQGSIHWFIHQSLECSHSNCVSSCDQGDWVTPPPRLHRDQLAIFSGLRSATGSHHQPSRKPGANNNFIFFLFLFYFLQVIAGCVFSVIFPLFIVSGNQVVD